MADKFYAGGGPVPGTIDYSVPVVLTSTADNSPILAIDAGSVTAYYYRLGAAAPVQIVPVALASTDAAHVDGGWREISSTLVPGWYRFDVPDAVFAAGADWAALQIRVTGAFHFNAPFPLQSSALIPDQILKRDWATMVDDIGNRRCVWNAMRPLRNRWVLTPTAYSVKKENDNDEAWAASVSTVAGAAAVTAIDPS